MPPSNEIYYFHWWICEKKNIQLTLGIQNLTWLSVLVVGQYHSKFSRKEFCSVSYLSVIYMYKEPSEAILSVNFGLFEDDFFTSFI